VTSPPAAGLAGGLFAFSKGSIDPTLISIPMSVDFLVMTLLGGVQTVIGPLVAWAVLSRGADVRTVILASIVPGVLVTMLAAWAVRGGEGRRGADRMTATSCGLQTRR